MKHIIILGDGMADEPIEKLGGLTPLQYANTPAMDRLAREGAQGLLTTVPEGFHPGSEIANLAVLGYDVREVFEGRGSLEAASMGVDIAPDEMAMRCNIICLTPDGKIKNHSAGHITTEEATELIQALQKELGYDRVSFHPGVSYRHLIKIKNADKRLECFPPHDHPGEPWRPLLIKAQVPEAQATADLLNDLIVRSQKVLENHPVNLARKAKGQDMANSIWPWSPGYKPDMQPLTATRGVKNGTVISAVDLIKGIGVYAGLKPVEVEGATGLYNTNYEGKAQAAIDALRGGDDFVFLHVEASDEAGHEGDIDLKVKTIEYLDQRIIAPILEAEASLGEPLAIAVLPDHPTPCRVRTHTRDAVPFLIRKPGVAPDGHTEYNEITARRGSYGSLVTSQFIEAFLKQ